MPAKKRKTKARPKRVKAKKSGSKKKIKKARAKPKRKAKPKPKKAKAKKSKPARLKAPAKIETALRDELEKQGKDIFFAEKWSFGHWFRKYSPVIITLLIGLATYFYLIFYLFYPTALLHGHYVQLLALLIFIFLIAGILVYLGIRAELLFVRILSFIFVFVIFTFLLLFILLANTMNLGLG